MNNTIKDDSFTNNVAERITLNSILSSRVYLNDNKKFAENLSEINISNDFSVNIDNKTVFNEQYTEALNVELFNYFSPISPADLFENSNNPLLQANKYICYKSNENKGEYYYISEDYIIKYYEGVFKVSDNKNLDIIDYVKNNLKNKKGKVSLYKTIPEKIMKEIHLIEPRFSFGLFISSENSINENKEKKKRTFHISFRGTDPDIKEFSKTESTQSDFVKYFTHDYPNMSNHYEMMKPFVEQAIKLSKSSNIKNMEITGHSLGGAMVDVFMEKNNNNKYLKNVNYQGYAFGNPFGISTRNKLEQFWEGEKGQKIHKIIDKFLNLDAENMTNKLRRNIRKTSKSFLNLSINTGMAFGFNLVKIQPNEVFQNYIKNLALKFTINSSLLLSNVGVRLICNLYKITKQTFSSTQYVDEKFKKIEYNPASRIISIQHSGDPIPMGGSLIYNHKGTRYLVQDKHEKYSHGKISILSNFIEKISGYSFHNHKSYNYVVSCVQRVEINTNSPLSQAIRNVNHTFQSLDKEFKKQKDCKNIFDNIKKLRNRSISVSHSVDKQIPF